MVSQVSPAISQPGYEVGLMTLLVQRRKLKDKEFEYLVHKAATLGHNFSQLSLHLPSWGMMGRLEKGDAFNISS